MEIVIVFGMAVNYWINYDDKELTSFLHLSKYILDPVDLQILKIYEVLQADEYLIFDWIKFPNIVLLCLDKWNEFFLVFYYPFADFIWIHSSLIVYFYTNSLIVEVQPAEYIVVVSSYGYSFYGFVQGRGHIFYGFKDDKV